MKRVFLIACVLLIAVISTACINNLAVQDLNNKANNYMQQNEYQEAIRCLKSSLELDSSIFETHYNLAVAYTEVEDYINAVDQYQKALNIKPNDSDVYYSLATAQNNLAVDMSKGLIKMNPDNTLYKYELRSEDETLPEMTDTERQYMESMFDSAIVNYEKYIELNPESKDAVEVSNQIDKIKSNKEKRQKEAAEKQ